MHLCERLTLNHVSNGEMKERKSNGIIKKRKMKIKKKLEWVKQRIIRWDKTKEKKGKKEDQ